eukprot:CAMPEP_0174255858 /NCGR_PEP_ID=MMETSP0439-20130205/5150_1 /TAXON_ID=0 /ORGANISM="Stereomyxa ramosa, Strain Chinc5" /LENGTH=333 /DNA_ID=CAMNT_0015338227 /DNA_START=96 /DNA_END=1097 /DNA_ORIENTATION=+
MSESSKSSSSSSSSDSEEAVEVEIVGEREASGASSSSSDSEDDSQANMTKESSSPSWPEPVVLAGTLWKLGGQKFPFFKNWKRRVFHLGDNSLAWFYSADDAKEGKYRGCVPLKGSKILAIPDGYIGVASYAYAFIFTTPSSEEILIHGDTPEEQAQWVVEISKRIQTAEDIEIPGQPLLEIWGQRVMTGFADVPINQENLAAHGVRRGGGSSVRYSASSSSYSAPSSSFPPSSYSAPSSSFSSSSSSASSSHFHVSASITNTGRNTVKIYYGTGTPPFGSGTYSSIGGNTTTSHTFSNPNVKIWIVDSSNKGISCTGPAKQIRINPSGTGFC